jgi:hypothetical protein
MRALSLFVVLVGLLHPVPVWACMDPVWKSFRQQIGEARTVFIFRLESTEARRTQLGSSAHMEWIHGRIRVVSSLKGDASGFRSVRFSTGGCDAVRLDTGHYFLAATRDSGPELDLLAQGRSVIDLKYEYVEDARPERREGLLLRSIRRHLSDGEPLPAELPDAHRRFMTDAFPPVPPPPAPATRR